MKLKRLTLPAVFIQKGKLMAALKLCKSRQEKKDKCFFAAMGFVTSLDLMLEVFLQCAASRPRDAEGMIVKLSKPCYLAYNNNPVYKTMAVFHTTDFKEFAKEVQTAEDLELSGYEAGRVFTSPFRGGIEDVFNAKMGMWEANLSKTFAGLERGIEAGFSSVKHALKGEAADPSLRDADVAAPIPRTRSGAFRKKKKKAADGATAGGGAQAVPGAEGAASVGAPGAFAGSGTPPPAHGAACRLVALRSSARPRGHSFYPLVFGRVLCCAPPPRGGC